ncbi:MAG: right-handed parallel beta-helix repeat-containing protein [Planctomycetota bacterium]
MLNPFNYEIIDDYSGGDCVQIGFWYPQSKTCVLTNDLDDVFGNAIRILSDGITLDGNGHSITHDPLDEDYYTIGVYAVYVSNVTVKNLTVSGFRSGISFSMDGTDNKVLDNFLYENSTGIIFGYNENGTLSGNTIKNSGSHAMACSHGRSITIVNNNFIDSVKYPLHVYKIKKSVIEGNYWSIYDRPANGCYDDNSDGICDDPLNYRYKLTTKIKVRVTDMMPYTTVDGWNSK